MSPNLKSEKVIAGPVVDDGDVVRLIKMPDGSGRIEFWVKGAGWTEAAPGAPAGPLRLAMPLGSAYQLRNSEPTKLRDVGEFRSQIFFEDGEFRGQMCVHELRAPEREPFFPPARPPPALRVVRSK
jgi:hypothetical protein